jgi:AAHS family 4-hydroxybenzoate transporter-like MFS transporter
MQAQHTANEDLIMSYIAPSLAMRNVTITPSQSINIGELLDFNLSGFHQRMVVLLTAFAIIFDGMNIQMMGFAIPSIAKDWGVARSSFAPILALGLVGLAVGTAFGGLIGDRIGRRTALIGSVFLFGTGTLCIAFVHSLTGLLVLRLIAGAGIGGALPNATTLTAEFTPLKWKAVAITIAIVCIPLGGFLAGLISAHILSRGNWRELFWIGGGASIALAILLTFLLPESPRFLAQRPARHAELVQQLRRMHIRVKDDCIFVEPAEVQGKHPGIVAALFGPGKLRSTLSLWWAFFLCLATIFLVFNWLPSLLTSLGLNIKVTSDGLAAYNFGGVFGALSFAWWINRRGSRVPLLVGSAGGLITALILRFMPIDPAADPTLLFVALGAHGLFVNAVQTTMYALAAHIYPTKIRATGVAAALAIGRTGAILSAFIGPSILHQGSQVYFATLAVGMGGVFIALAILRHHIEAAHDRTVTV